MSSSKAATTLYCLFPRSLFTLNSLQRRGGSHSSVYQYSAWHKEIYLHDQIDFAVFTSYSQCLEQCLSQSRCSVKKKEKHEYIYIKWLNKVLKIPFQWVNKGFPLLYGYIWTQWGHCSWLLISSLIYKVFFPLGELSLGTLNFRSSPLEAGKVMVKFPSHGTLCLEHKKQC